MPNTVVKLTNAESTWLEAAREDRKLLINMKAPIMQMVGAFYFVWRFWLAGIDGGMKDYEGRSSPACHFERKREIFSVCGQSVYACERKREA